MIHGCVVSVPEPGRLLCLADVLDMKPYLMIIENLVDFVLEKCVDSSVALSESENSSGWPFCRGRPCAYPLNVGYLELGDHKGTPLQIQQVV